MVSSDTQVDLVINSLTESQYKNLLSNDLVEDDQIYMTADDGLPSAGGPYQPVYATNGTPTACSFTVQTSVPAGAIFTDTDTKNTAGATIGTSMWGEEYHLVGCGLAGVGSDSAETYSAESCYFRLDAVCAPKFRQTGLPQFNGMSKYEEGVELQQRYTYENIQAMEGRVLSVYNMAVNNITNFTYDISVQIRPNNYIPSDQSDRTYARDFTVTFTQPAEVKSVTFLTSDTDGDAVSFVAVDGENPFSTMSPSVRYEFYFSEVTSGEFRVVRKSLSSITQ